MGAKIYGKPDRFCDAYCFEEQFTDDSYLFARRQFGTVIKLKIMYAIRMGWGKGKKK